MIKVVTHIHCFKNDNIFDSPIERFYQCQTSIWNLYLQGNNFKVHVYIYNEINEMVEHVT
jgi:hypothetical protein